DVLGLPLVGRLAGELGELGDALDESGDLVPELAPDVGGRPGRVLGHVMEHRRGDRGGGHPELRDEQRDGRGVLDVRTAGHAALIAVRLGGVAVRAAHELRVAVRVVPEHPLDRGLGVDLLPVGPELVGDPDDARGEAGVVGLGGLGHYATTSSSANLAAVATRPKSRSSSSTKPVRPEPTLTTASTRPASVIASARSPRRKAIASKVNLPPVIWHRRWSESAPTWRMPYTRTSRSRRCGRGLSAPHGSSIASSRARRGVSASGSIAASTCRVGIGRTPPSISRTMPSRCSRNASTSFPLIENPAAIA